MPAANVPVAHHYAFELYALDTKVNFAAYRGAGGLDEGRGRPYFGARVHHRSVQPIRKSMPKPQVARQTAPERPELLLRCEFGWAVSGSPAL
jgi:hypothetical protein